MKVLGVLACLVLWVSSVSAQGLFWKLEPQIENAGYLNVSGIPGTDVRAELMTHARHGEGFFCELSTLVDGTYSVTAQGCDIWDNCGVASNPFDFSKPVSVGKPGTPQLTK